jgi:hypothetical protein
VVPLAKQRSSVARIYLDHHRISGSMTAGTFNVNQSDIPITSIEDEGPRSLIDNYTTDDDLTAFGEYAAGEWDAILYDLLDDEAEHYLGRFYVGTAENSPVWDGVVRVTREPLVVAVGAAQMHNAGFSGASGVSRGLVLRSATITGTGNGTGRNLGVTTAGQRFAVTYRVLSGTFTSFDLKVQGSSDNGGADAYADIAGLTQSFSAVGAARKSIITATEAWKRITVANWVGTNAVILVTAGRVAG